jgi:hypothetical protein
LEDRTGWNEFELSEDLERQNPQPEKCEDLERQNPRVELLER